MPSVAWPVPAQSPKKCSGGRGQAAGTLQSPGMGVPTQCSRPPGAPGTAHAWPGRWLGNWWCLVPGSSTSPSAPAPVLLFGSGGQMQRPVPVPVWDGEVVRGGRLQRRPPRSCCAREASRRRASTVLCGEASLFPCHHKRFKHKARGASRGGLAGRSVWSRQRAQSCATRAPPTGAEGPGDCADRNQSKHTPVRVAGKGLAVMKDS